MPIFASGTKTFFQQTSAPTGWVKDTSMDNAGIRIVSGTVGTGGSANFSEVFASRRWEGTLGTSGNVGDFTLSTGNLPSHNHSYSYIANPAVATTYATTPYVSYSQVYLSPTLPVTASGPAGGGASHTHSLSLSLTFTGDFGDFGVKYIDVILASKA